MESQTGPLRKTKLNPPILHSDAVARPRLLEQLERNVRRPLTLVSASAGYGKSTLIAQWLDSSSLPGVWLSLDEGDNDPRSFLAYFVAAVRRHTPRACQGTLDLILAAELPSPAVLANRLANELESISKLFILVLDDYHRVTNPDIHELLNELLAHPPRSLHLSIVTRRDPPLPLSSMQAKGLAIEIREADIKFSEEETSAVFHDIADIDLDSESLTRIMEGFEGWIVGLRLLCLNLRYQEDPKAYLSRLRVDLSLVQEYLVEQVLSRQTEEVQDWLLKTSILDRFCPSLCDTLCAGDSEPGLTGREFVRSINEANLFAIDLDIRGKWLRYHHLFRQVLGEILENRESPEEIRELHRRASRWFSAEGLVDEALEHALAAEDAESAADIIEQYRVSTLNADQWPVLARWLAQIPEEIVWSRPELLLGEAWICYYRFRIPALARIVERLDELLKEDSTHPAAEGELAVFKSYLCYWQGQAREMLTHVAAAREKLPLTHDLMRADSEIYFGLAHHMAGQKDVAIEALTHRLRENPEQKSLMPTRRMITLAFIHLLSGDLKQCAIHSRLLGELAWTSSPVYITSWSKYLLGCCHLQAGQWEEAEHCFRWMVENRYAAHTATVMSSLLGRVMALHFLGRLVDESAAAQLLQEYAVETRDQGNLAIADSARARLELLHGHAAIPSDTEILADEAFSLNTSFLFLEVPVITRYRLIVCGNPGERLEEALEAIIRLKSAAQALHNNFQLIDILVLEAVALNNLDRAEEAADALQHALEAAAPGEWVRPFVEPGRIVAELLSRHRPQLVAHETQIDHILEQFDKIQEETPSPGSDASRSDRPLIVTLTNREQEVLELLAERLYDKEIADKLGVSITTVKTHLRNIYQKLEAGNRREAVIRAVELGLLKT